MEKTIGRKPSLYLIMRQASGWPHLMLQMHSAAIRLNGVHKSITPPFTLTLENIEVLAQDLQCIAVSATHY
jgi:hypothetical protein